MFKKNSVFRQQAIENITSPEKIGIYIKIANPSIVILILASTFFIISLGIWSIFYKIDTIISIGTVCKNGIVECFLNETDFEKIKSVDKPILIFNSKSYEIKNLNLAPKRVNESNFSYAMHKSRLKPGDWFFTIKTATNQKNDGTFNAHILLNKVSPISFIFN